ncbi:hypothetical protein [Fulvivirga imtechensis]|uniref:hypothetical protein n=1 Tax=Fulvivirga imtechensis TaxID=881893 RepID=UPI00058FFD4E|nr:hypothetical protein [Fulvivirga imtechensis]
MKRVLTISLLVLSLLFACDSAKYTTVKHVKPDNRNRFFNKKKDKHKKRVKYVKVKILKQSKEVKPPRKKPPKTKKIKETEEIKGQDLENVENESDSTGLLY